MPTLYYISAGAVCSRQARPTACTVSVKSKLPGRIFRPGKCRQTRYEWNRATFGWMEALNKYGTHLQLKLIVYNILVRDIRIHLTGETWYMSGTRVLWRRRSLKTKSNPSNLHLEYIHVINRSFVEYWRRTYLSPSSLWIFSVGSKAASSHLKPGKPRAGTWL